MNKHSLYLLCSFCCYYLAIGLLSAQLPDEFSDQIVSNEFDLPMGITFDDQHRMFVWEKAGLVYIVDAEGNKLPNPLLDISEEVGNWRDHGLLGFALDPNFSTNGHFYLLYAVDRHHLLYFGTPDYSPDSTATFQASIGRITRYTADPSTNFENVIPNSRKVLLGETKGTGFILIHESHGVGSLIFGTDGSLLASCGDGNSNLGDDFTGGDEWGSYASQAVADGIMSEDLDIGTYRAQYLGSLNGKVLRLDPETGAGIPSNPFYDAANPSSAKSRIWAYGLRNPYRMILRPNTGSHSIEDGDPGVLYLGDVGGANWEELDVVTEGGQNFGWPIVEGLIPHWGYWNNPSPASKITPNPLYESGSCSQEYFTLKDLFTRPTTTGTYIFPNPCDENQAIPDEYTAVETPPILTWSNLQWNQPTRALVPYFNSDGNIDGLEITDSNSPIQSEHFEGGSSIAGLFYDDTAFPEQYHGKYFHADFSSNWIRILDIDENNTISSVDSFHNASNQIIQLINHPTDGCIYYVSLINNGQIRKICYGGNPPPIAIPLADTIYGTSPLTVQFSSEASFDPFGDPLSFFWNFDDGTSSSENNPTHTFVASSSAPQTFNVHLTATDSLGLSASSSIIISLNNTPPLVEITSFNDGDFYSINGETLLPLQAAVSDNEHSLESLEFTWQTFLHHNTHFHPESASHTPNSTTIISPNDCEELFYYRIRLDVRDPNGLTTFDERILYPYCEEPIVQFINIRAEAQQDRVDVFWETTDDSGISTFEIQRAELFNSFYTIGELEANGNNEYSFSDIAPLKGKNRYRIKATFMNIYDYSEEDIVEFPPKPDIAVYPNPAGNVVFIELKKPAPSVNFKLYNTLGVIISSANWTGTPNETLSRTILTNTLANGVYYYELNNGEEKILGSLVISK